MAYSKNRRLAEIVSDTSGNLSVEGIIVPTQSSSDNDTSAASTAFVHTHIDAVFDAAPGTLNTLNEIAAALNDDANFNTTVTNAIAAKLPLSGGNLTGNIALTTSNTKISMTSTGSGDSELYFQTASNGRGIYLDQSDANKLKIYDGSGKGTAGEVIIDNTGQVGIGSSPNAFLSVRKDNNNSGNQFVVADTEGATAAIRTYTHNGDDTGLILNHYYAKSGSGNEYMRYADFVANVGNGAGTTMRFITKNAANTFTTGLVQDNNGNVGIGTTAPHSKLHLVETASGAAGIDFPLTISSDRYQADYGVGIAFRPENQSTGYKVKTAIIASGGGYGYNQADLHFCLDSDNTVTNEVSLSDARMTIKKSGNVGIDETAPLAKLHVVGGRANGTVYNTIIAAGGVNSTDGSGARLILSGCENDPLARGTVIEGISTGTGNSHKLRFKTNNGSSTPSTRMTISHTGKVGIGYDLPGQKLQIAEGANYSPPGLGGSAAHFGIFKIDSGIPKYGMITGVESSGKVWQQVQRVDSTATAYNLMLQPSGGNIEIGTNTNMGFAGQTSPNTPIHVGMSTSTGPRIQISHEDNGGFGALDIDAYGSATFRILSNFSGSTMNGVATGKFGLVTPHGRDIVIGTNGLERIRVGADSTFSVGTSPATSRLIVNAAGDTGLGTDAPFHSKKKKVEVTVTTAITSNAHSVNSGNNGGYDVSGDDATVAWGNLKAMTVAGVYNKPVLEMRIIGNMAANTWYPIATMGQLTNWQNDLGSNEYNGFSMYFRIYTYDTGVGGGEYLGSRMSERIWVNAYTCNSTQRHNLHVGAGWGHAPNNGQTAAGSGPYQLSIKHHMNTDSYYPAVQTIEFLTTAAKTGLTGTSNKNITIYGHVG